MTEVKDFLYARPVEYRVGNFEKGVGIERKIKESGWGHTIFEICARDVHIVIRRGRANECVRALVRENYYASLLLLFFHRSE